MGTPSTELQEQMDERDEEVVEESKGGNFEEAMEGVASIALLPCGSLSGHFIHRQDASNVCFGLQGTEEERKGCSCGAEAMMLPGCRALIMLTGSWEEDVVDLVEEQHG
ncbi:hypothetical protein D8674_018380 [Pyrus ussuriensis x Pyrus communis]|uniref:Uncharacterized protein n=1 Tax=Pyrus ussuriensis x Pyrus communis TaxID=2448454 RepID=A0A5N5G532_9ROSA|nr:hypothetical protein D8674_018380 [Pyrus ussuriensis x Pyrus communis]